MSQPSHIPSTFCIIYQKHRMRQWRNRSLDPPGSVLVTTQLAVWPDIDNLTMLPVNNALAQIVLRSWAMSSQYFLPEGSSIPTGTTQGLRLPSDRRRLIEIVFLSVVISASFADVVKDIKVQSRHKSQSQTRDPLSPYQGNLPSTLRWNTVLQGGLYRPFVGGIISS
jgi:hypothetical protein